MIRFAVALAAIAAAPAFAAPLSPADAAKVDAIVAREMARTETPSVSIAVVRDGEIAFTKAYGKASDRLAATTSLPYQIASNSKQFTAMALLLLEDEGKISLDDPVSKYLPEITGGDRIKVRQLLSHTAGISDYWPQDYAFEAMATPVDPKEIAKRWAIRPLDFDPGTKEQYSNTGYVVAGLIAEKVSGQPLMAFLRQRIFRPLGMTSVVSQDDATGAAFPVGYGRAALGPVRAEPPAARGWLYAAGELSMTPTDLAKWDIARMNRALVPAADWAAQETSVKLADGSDIGYGLGVTVANRKGHKLIAHSGESVGFLSVNYVYPDDKAAVIVMTNTWSGDAYRAIVRDVSDLILPAAATAAVTPVRDAKVAALYAQLVAGKPDPALMTPNLQYYFTPQRIADFSASLAPLGKPLSIAAAGEPSLRGGFVIQPYTIKFPSRELSLSVFTEPGDNGRVEQYLISPGE